METTGFAHFKVYSKQSKFLWKSIIRLQDLLIKSWLFSATLFHYLSLASQVPICWLCEPPHFSKLNPHWRSVYYHTYICTYIHIHIYTISTYPSTHPCPYPYPYPYIYIYIHMYVVNISKTAAVLFRCVTTVTGASSTARWTSMPCKTSWDRESTWPRIGGLNHNSPDYIVVRCGSIPKKMMIPKILMMMI
jgi:hypothetical protein